jgi:LysR family transcriptional regulator for bpeEF and oprC
LPQRHAVRASPNVVRGRVGSVEFITCATPTYLAAREPLCHPSQLENTHPVLRYAFPSSGKHNRVEFVRGDEQIVIDGNYVVAVNDSNGYRATGLAGLGVLHTLRFMVQSHLDSGKLVLVLEGWSARANTLSVVYMPDRHLSVRVQAFVDWLVEYFATHPQVIA